MYMYAYFTHRKLTDEISKLRQQIPMQSERVAQGMYNWKWLDIQIMIIQESIECRYYGYLLFRIHLCVANDTGGK